jgi:hypothetical protein
LSLFLLTGVTQVGVEERHEFAILVSLGQLSNIRLQTIIYRIGVTHWKQESFLSCQTIKATTTPTRRVSFRPEQHWSIAMPFRK